MTFDEICKANKAIHTTDIKGKDYAEVNQRIKAFRMLYPSGSIITEIVSIENGICVMRAQIIDDDGRILGTGTAYESESSSFINKTSYIENCETSAVGRALGMCGIGIDTSVASYEEVANAIQNQNPPPANTKSSIDEQQRANILAEMNRTGINKNTILKAYKLRDLADMSVEQYTSCMNRFKATKTRETKNE